MSPRRHPAAWFRARARLCFAGYLVLDALIAKRDRQEENWVR